MEETLNNKKNYTLAGYRTMLGKTQEDFANILGISKQSYNQKELGHTRFKDEEKIILKKYINDKFPDVSYELLFLTNKYSKVFIKERYKCKIKISLSFKFN